MSEKKPVPSKDELKKKLDSLQYHVTQEKGTERAFTGKYWNNHEKGSYNCVCCGQELFDSSHKFDSGTGWPSFDRPIKNGAVASHTDKSHFMIREEVLCSGCGAHLGHVFDDGPASTGLRFCINSASLDFKSCPESGNNKSKPEPVKERQVFTQQDDDIERSKGLNVAYFAAGCFWGVEDIFKSINGVLDTTVGYTGGITENPTYQEVCGHRSKHAEALRLVYDPEIVSFEALLLDFFKMHDPTTLNRQGPDIGDQYRSAIFYTSDSERQEANSIIDKVQQSGQVKGKIVTTLEKFDKFYSAEEYHQDYFAKHGGGGCHVRF